MGANTRNYTEIGGETTVIGGSLRIESTATLTVEDGATVTGLGGGGNGSLMVTKQASFMGTGKTEGSYSTALVIPLGCIVVDAFFHVVTALSLDPSAEDVPSVTITLQTTGDILAATPLSPGQLAVTNSLTLMPAVVFAARDSYFRTTASRTLTVSVSVGMGPGAAALNGGQLNIYITYVDTSLVS